MLLAQILLRALVMEDTKNFIAVSRRVKPSGGIVEVNWSNRVAEVIGCRRTTGRSASCMLAWNMPGSGNAP